jgi:hypothetical protein
MIDRLFGEFGEVFIALVCGIDGIACLSGKEYRWLMHSIHEDQRLRVGRRAHQMYLIRASDPERECQIANGDYPAKVYAAIS